MMGFARKNELACVFADVIGIKNIECDKRAMKTKTPLRQVAKFLWFEIGGAVWPNKGRFTTVLDESSIPDKWKGGIEFRFNDDLTHSIDVPILLFGAEDRHEATVETLIKQHAWNIFQDDVVYQDGHTYHKLDISYEEIGGNLQKLQAQSFESFGFTSQELLEIENSVNRADVERFKLAMGFPEM